MEIQEIYLSPANEPRSNSRLALLAGIGIGLATMYFIDPQRGTRRRHVLGDKAKRGLRVSRRELHDVARNARNHARGKLIEMRNRRREGEVDDSVLVQRVRAELGHHVERARAVEVTAEQGLVVLSGTVPPEQIERAEKTARSVSGVLAVENLLTPEGVAGRGPSLNQES